jgi:hypothetical protein
MQVDHKYMAQMLNPYVLLAEGMDDKLVAYLLGMLIQHCHEMVRGDAKPDRATQPLKGANANLVKLRRPTKHRNSKHAKTRIRSPGVASGVETPDRSPLDDWVPAC